MRKRPHCGSIGRLWMLGLLALLTLSAAPARAQMSDEAVARYALEGKKSGKSEQQIGKELLARGVTPAQIERLKQKYEESQGSEVAVANQSVQGQDRERMRSSAETLTAGSLDVMGAQVDPPTTDTTSYREVFGRNIFRTPSLTFEPNENQATPENYRLGPGDEIIIDIWGENEQSLRKEISPEGNIMVEQVGPVYLTGLTIREAESKLRSIFGKIYAGVSGDLPTSQMRLSLGRLRTIQVNVMGEVATPGTFRLSPFSTVFHALYRAGGISPIGGLRNIRLMRGGREVARVDVYDVLLNGRFSDEIRLEEGDVIVVPPYELMVDISGKVKRPMYYEMKRGETLGRLLEYAGGFTGDAFDKEIRVVRKTGREYKLHNVRADRAGEWMLDDGDAATVGAVLDRFENRVEVRGAVYREGMYELSDEMRTVRDLIDRADGLKGDAFLDRVQLLREREDLTLELLPLDLNKVMNGGENPELRRNDVLIIPSIHELKERGAFTITGEVARPGEYPYAENTKVEDLILQAGGLLDGASTVRVDVSRRVKDPESRTATHVMGHIYTLSIKNGLVMDGSTDFKLEPYDIVEVRRSPGYQPQRRVTLEGEVVFEGGYTLMKKTERLSDLVQRAGGLTSDAYVRGARLLRQMTPEERAVRDATLRMAQQHNRGEDSLALDKLKMDETYSVGIELDKALAKPGSDYDMVLREGDRLVIPEYVSTVSIAGEVMYPNTVLFKAGMPLDYYISQAGGYGYRAKKSRAYIVYMNGTVARVRGRNKSNVEPGCEIIIPSKRQRKSMSLQAIMSLATSAASIGTMAASIANLSK